ARSALGTEMDACRHGLEQPGELGVLSELLALFLAPGQLDRIAPDHQRQVARQEPQMIVERYLAVQLVEEWKRHAAAPPHLGGERSGGVDKAAGGDRLSRFQAYRLDASV